jgi:vacuolar-type H+-ATPase subunit H
MPTPIEKINEAEQSAEEIRQKALEKSRDDIRSAQEDMAKKQKEKISSARRAAREKLEGIQKNVDAEIVSKNDEDKAQQDEYKKSSMVNIDKASNMIVKRILNV